MKNIIQILSVILGSATFIVSVFIINQIQAGNATISPSDYKHENPAKIQPSAIGEIVNQPAEHSLSSMTEDPKYWVNYLNRTVKPDEETLVPIVSVVDEMQNNPTFWVDNLKQLGTEN